MTKLFYTALLALIFITNSISQSSVAIIGWDASGSSSSGDEVSFALLRDFVAGEVIYITEDEYVAGANTFNSSEGHLAYTIPAGGLLEGTVVSIVESSSGTYSEQCGTGGTVTGTGSWSLAADPLGGMADEIYAYSASNPAAPWSSVIEVYCFIWSATSAPNSGQNPATDYPNAFIVTYNVGGAAGINAQLMDAARTNTSIPDYMNGANWNQAMSNITLSCMPLINHALPIELISFDSKLRGKEVMINWTTATEINNERFEIEHSLDGRNFSLIGTVAGNGNSTEKNHYQMKHSSPASGMNYYRLKQLDFDGAHTYSDIISERISEKENISSIFPNPFYDQVTVEFSGSEFNYSNANKRIVTVYDNFGKLLITKETAIDDKSIVIDLSSLSKGIYFIKLAEGDTTVGEVQRIVKL